MLLKRLMIQMTLGPHSILRGCNPTLSAPCRALFHTLPPHQGHYEAPAPLNTCPNLAREMHVQQWRTELAALARLSEDFHPQPVTLWNPKQTVLSIRSLGSKQPALGTSATQAKCCITTSPHPPTITIATTGADYLARHFNSDRRRPSFPCYFPK